MIEIDYRLSPSWNRELSTKNLAETDEMSLRYDTFLGDIIFIVNGADFSARWGWVPIVDFAACLLYAIKDLSTGNERTSFDFTESDDELIFELEAGIVIITSTYNSGRASVLLSDLGEAVVEFSRKLASDLQELYPETSQNSTIRKLLLDA
jgi:hypothetical protein